MLKLRAMGTTNDLKWFRKINDRYEMPKSAVNYRKPRRLSAEQRQAASERANNLHNKGDKSVS